MSRRCARDAEIGFLTHDGWRQALSPVQQCRCLAQAAKVTRRREFYKRKVKIRREQWLRNKDQGKIIHV